MRAHAKAEAFLLPLLDAHQTAGAVWTADLLMRQLHTHNPTLKREVLSGSCKTAAEWFLSRGAFELSEPRPVWAAAAVGPRALPLPPYLES